MNKPYTLADLAMYNIEKLASELEKQAFEPMIGGQPSAPAGAPAGMPPGSDPSMAAGAPPMDPNMMAAGGMPAAGSPPPAAAPAAPSASPDPAMMDVMVQAVRQVLQESGGAPQGGAVKGKGGKDIEERMSAIEAALAQVLQKLGLANPEQAVADAVSVQSQPADVMSSGSGQPADGGMMPQAIGALDPNAAQSLSDLKIPTSVGGTKMSSARPLDGVARALRKVRGK